MRWSNTSLLLLLLLLFWVLPSALRAQLVVTDPALTQVAGEILGQSYQLNHGLVQVGSTLDTLLRYEGNPQVAARGIERWGSFVTNVGRMGQPRYRAEAWAQERNVEQRMKESRNPYRHEVGDHMPIAGRSVARAAVLYEERLAEEAVWEGVRSQREVNRQHQHTLLGRLSTVNQRLERASTHQELVAAQLEMDRLRTLMEGAQLLADNLQADAEALSALRDLAQEDELARAWEQRWEAARSRREVRENHYRVWRQAQLRGLATSRLVTPIRF